MKIITQFDIHSVFLTKDCCVITENLGEEYRFSTDDFSWAHSIKPGMTYTKYEDGQQTLTVNEG